MDLVAGRPPPRFDNAKRSTQSEVLDSPVDTAELAKILADLARFNRAMLGHQPVLQWLDRATRKRPAEQTLTLVDIGCGYGDLLRAVRHWARKRGRSLRLIGIDLIPQVIDVARAATDPAEEIAYHAGDVFSFAPDGPVDLVTASLVTHHFADGMIVRFLRWMEDHARCGWVIYDLQRNLVPYYFIPLAGWLMHLHPVVVYDGRISVARSLKQYEWRQRLTDAGISADIRWFMFRFAIGRIK